MKANSVLPTDADKHQFVQSMFDRIAPRYALMNRIITLGLDRRWRKLAVSSLELKNESVVIDIACGPGELCVELGLRGLRAVGTDLSWGMLSHSPRGNGNTPNGANYPLLQSDAAYLPIATSCAEGITCGFALRNFAQLDLVLKEAGRVLKPNGRISILEVSSPKAAIVRILHKVYFNNVVPFLGGLLSDGTAYKYLPQSASYLPDFSELSQMMVDAGFLQITTRPLAFGATQLITAIRR